MTFKDTIISYIKSGSPLIQCETLENDRVSDETLCIVNDFNTEILPNLDTEDTYLKTSGIRLMTWDILSGIRNISETGILSTPVANTKSPELAIAHLSGSQVGPCLCIMHNFHFFFKGGNLPTLIQGLRDFYNVGKVSHKHIMFVGGSGIPMELQSYITYADFPLPDKESLSTLVKEIGEIFEIKTKSNDMLDICSTLSGLTEMEAGKALYLSAISTKGKSFDKQTLFESKAQMIKRSGLLEHIPLTESIATVGGLANLKDWCMKVDKTYQNREAAEKYRLPFAKGCLLAGVSGTGKTLTAMVLANLFKVPLYRMDVGRLFGSLVGETERQSRELFKLLDALGSCVVLCDEVEKSLAGLASSNSSDAGVTARLIGNLLYYLQERKTQAFFVFTANDITSLPPELMRKGRLDQIFFCDLPVMEERVEILTIHLNKVGRKPEDYDLNAIAGNTENFTGAEIEGVIKEAMFNAFYRDEEFTTDDILNVAHNTVPLATTKSEDIQALRDWAKDRARAANGSLLQIQAVAVGKKKTRSLAKDKHWAETGRGGTA